MGYCDVAVRGSERYRRCALELDIAIFVLCGFTSAARQSGVLKSPAGKPAGLLGCCEKKGIGSVFLQRGVFLVQRFLALEVGLDASVACADLLVGVHMRHLVHVVLFDSLEQVRSDEGGVHALDGDVAVEQAAVIRSLLFIGKLKGSPTTRALIHEKSSLAPPGQSLAFSLGDEKGFEWIGAYDITGRASCRGGHRQDRKQDRTGANTPPREFEHPTPVGKRHSRLRVEIPTLSLLNSCCNR